MHTTDLAPLFQAHGPFATVQVDVSHETEHGEHEHALRVRAACDRLAEQGADPAVVDHVTRVLMEPVDQPAPVSRLVVANSDGVQYDEVGAFRVDDVNACWGPLPDLAPWIAHRDSAVRFVLAVVDHVGGDVSVHDTTLSGPIEEETVQGETQYAHHVATGGWAMLKFQHTNEKVWAENAGAVADRIISQVRAGHHLVLLGGDPRSVSMVKERLEGLQEATVVEINGSRSEDGGDDALWESVRQALADHVTQRRLALVHELKERLGRGTAVATGVDDVAEAFVRGQVQTLLLDPAKAADLELDVSQHPGLSLGAEDQPSAKVRADQALVAAAVRTDADVAVSPAGTLGGTPVAALLRWDQ